MNNKNPFSAYDLMSAQEKNALNDRVATLSPYSPNVSTGFWDRTLEQVKAYNSLSLFTAEGQITNSYEDPSYSPSRDPLVMNNAWISKQYPTVWSSLMASKSKSFSYSIINNVNRNHYSASKIGEGSLGGIMFGGLMAGLIDPVNFLFPLLGTATKSGSVFVSTARAVGTAKKASRAAGLTLREKATMNAIENATVAALVEPLMQEADLTRSDIDGLMEIGMSAGFGAGFSTLFHVLGKGYQAGSKAASRKLTGYDTPQEAAEAFGPNVWAEASNTPEKKAYWDKRTTLKSFTDMTRQELEEGEKYINDAIQAVVPGLGKVKGIDKVLQWSFLNPVQQMMGSPSAKVKRLGHELVESIFEVEGNSGRAPVDSAIKLADHVFGHRIREHARRMDEFVADNPDIEINPDQIAGYVAHLARTGKSKVADVDVSYSINDIVDGKIVKRDPFQEIRGNKKLEGIIEAEVEDYRSMIKMLDGTADETGFLSSILRDYDINGMNLSSYVARWIDPNKVDHRLVQSGTGESVDLFVESIMEGIIDSKEATINGLQRDLFSLSAERKTLLKRIGEADTKVLAPDRGRNFNIELSKRTKERLEAELAVLNKRIDAIQEAMGAESWNDTSLRRLAMSIAHNYTAAYNEAAPKTRGGAGGAKEILRRKVSIDDRFITPWLVNDTRATLEKAQIHLLPKMILADEVMNRFLGGMNHNRLLNDKLKELSELEQELDNKMDIAGVFPEEADAIKINNLKDEIHDIVRESELIKEMLMVTLNPTNAAFFGNPLDRSKKFVSLEQAMNFVKSTIKDRIQTRDILAKDLETIKRLEQTILSQTKDLQIQELVNERTFRERELEAALNAETPEQPYLSILVGNYKPRTKDGFLSLDDEITDFDLDFVVDKRLSLSARIKDESNLPKRVKIVEVKGAVSKNFGEDPLSFESDDIPAFIVLKKDGKWGWVPPEQVAQMKRQAFQRKLDELPSGDPNILKVKAKLKTVKQGLEFKKSKKKVLQDIYEKRNAEKIATLEKKLDSVNEELTTRIGEVDDPKGLMKWDAEHKKAWESFHSNNRIFMNQTELLDDMARQTAEIRQNKDMPHLSSMAKKENVEADELSIFDGIGFDANFSYYERFGWHSASALRMAQGAEEIDLRSGYSTFQGEVYNSAVIAQEARRRNTQFYLDPEFMVADVVREGTLDAKGIAETRENLQFLFAQMQNKSISPDSDTNWQTFSRIVKNLNYMRYMGMVTIASLGDFANAVGTLGFGRYARTLFTVFDNWKDRDKLSAMSSVVAAGEMAGLDTRSTQLLGIDPANTFIDANTGAPRSSETRPGFWRSVANRDLEGSLRAVDDKTNQNSWLMNQYNRYGNFLSQWNAFNKRMVTYGLEDMVIEIAIKHGTGKKISSRDKGILEGLRFSDEDLDYIYKSWSAIDAQDPKRTRKKKVFGREFYLSNSGHWRGSQAYAYEMKIRGAVNSIIVSPTVGDLPKFFRDPKFEPLVQFKSFLMASTNKMFLPMVQRGILHRDPNQIAMVFGVSMLGTLSYAIYETAAGNNIFKDSEYTDEKTGEKKTRSWITKAVLEGIDRGGAFALLFSGSNMADRFFGMGIHSLFGGELNRKYRARTLGDTLLGPAGGLMDDILKTGTGLGDLVTQRGVSESQLTSMRRLLPWQNSVWVRLFADVAPSVVKALNEPQGVFVKESLRDRYFDNYSTAQGNVYRALGGE